MEPMVFRKKFFFINFLNIYACYFLWPGSWYRASILPTTFTAFYETIRL